MAAQNLKPSRWSNGLPRLLLILGAESALREEAIAAVRSAAFGDKSGGMNLVVLHGPASAKETSAITPADVLDEVCTASLFAAEELKVVLVRQADVFLSDKEWRDILERNVERIPAASTLVLEAASFGQLKNTKFYKSLHAAGAVIECEALAGRWGDSRELEAETERRARARGLQLSHGALLALLARSAKNLSVLQEELDKLALALGATDSESLSGAKTFLAGADGEESARPAAPSPRPLVPVTEAHIAEICASTNTYTGFNFVDAVIERSPKRALEVLGGLYARGVGDPSKPGKVITSETSITMLLLGALSWKLGQLQDAQAGLDAGKREYEAFTAAKVTAPFMQEQLRRTLRKFNGPALRRAMEALFRANLDLRLGGRQGQEVLEQLVWKIAR